MPTWKEINRTVGGLFQPDDIYIKVQDIPAHKHHFDTGIVVEENNIVPHLHRVELHGENFLPQDVEDEIRDAYPGCEIIPYAWFYDSRWIKFGCEIKLLVE